MPIYVDAFKKRTRLWVTLGVRLTKLEARFVRPPRLKCLEIRTRRNFAEKLLPRQPHFNVVSLGRSKAQVGSAQRHHAIMQSQPLQDYFRIVRQLF